MTGVFRHPSRLPWLPRQPQLIIPSSAPVAGDVSVDTSFKEETVAGGSPTITKSVTVGANANRALYVWALQMSPGYEFNAAADNTLAAAPTYNGVSMSLLATQTSWTLRASLYRLLNPATGANNLVVQRSNPGGLAVIGASLYNVHQTTPEGTPQTYDGGGESFNLSLGTGAAAGDLALAAIHAWAKVTFSPTPAAGQTTLETEDCAVTDTQLASWLETGGVDVDAQLASKAGGSGVTIGWTAYGGWTCAAIGVNVKKA